MPLVPVPFVPMLASGSLSIEQQPIGLQPMPDYA